MSLSSMHPGSSSQPPTDDVPVPNSDGPQAPNSDGGEGADAAVWKRRYLELKDTLNAQTSSKRKFR